MSSENLSAFVHVPAGGTTLASEVQNLTDCSACFLSYNIAFPLALRATMLKQNPCFRHLAAAFYTLLLTCTFAPTSLATIAQHDRAFYKFQTRPDIDAPVFNVHVYDAKAVSPGYWFVAPYGHLHQKTPGQGWVGPHIYDNHGELIWSGAPMLGHWNAFDFESRVVGGDRMLTFLSDHESHGFILNSSYQLHRKVALAPSRGAKPNMHEFNVFGDGKRALILTHTQEHAAKEAVQSLGLPWPCLVHYQGFKDVSLDPSDPTGTLFEWDASQHIGLDEVTYRKYDGTPQQQCKRGWDILLVQIECLQCGANDVAAISTPSVASPTATTCCQLGIRILFTRSRTMTDRFVGAWGA